MSGTPQTPNGFLPTTPQQQQQQQQQLARANPSTPQQMAMNMQQQQQMRPNMMQIRPGMTPIQQQQQHQMFMANAIRQGGGAVTPQQAQQAHFQQQQQMRPPPPGMGYPQMAGAGIRPGAGAVSSLNQLQQQYQFNHPGTASIAVAGVGIQGQQPHPALIQPHQHQQAGGRKRKGKGAAANDPSAASGADDGMGGGGGGGSGDELDSLQPYNISVARYQNNHSMMAEIFIALPTSTINVPGHYYEHLDKEQIRGELARYVSSFEESEKEHEAKIEGLRNEREQFSSLIRSLVEATPDRIDDIKTQMESHFGMEFVNSPYKTVDRIPICKIDAVDNAVYKQL
ncbi:hypothetical protein GGH99_000596 [Coemansia sp. RSA 1285]|nr:hypothetical protein GGH99_000596 [Coemansia sp. RSA 1285]